MSAVGDGRCHQTASGWCSDNTPTAAPVPVPDVREAVAAAIWKAWSLNDAERHGITDPRSHAAHMADAVLAIPAIATALGLSDE